MIRLVLSLVAITSLLGAASLQAVQSQSKGATSAAAKAARATVVVNINSASAAELDALPGIGAKTAARIVEYRQKNGPFKKIEELMNVRGVGEKNFLKLKAQITVGAAKAEHDRQNP